MPAATKSAVPYRMVMPGHTCPYRLKARHLLRRAGYAADDRPLRTRAQTDAFDAEHGVATTPQVFKPDDGGRGAVDAVGPRADAGVTRGGTRTVQVPRAD